MLLKKCTLLNGTLPFVAALLLTLQLSAQTTTHSTKIFQKQTPATGTAQAFAVSGLHPKSMFYENKGQVRDQHHHTRSDVRYIYSAPGFKLVIRTGGMSWDIIKTERAQQEVVSKPTQDIAGHMLQHHPVTMQVQHIDVDFVGSNPMPVASIEGISDYYENYHISKNAEDITNLHGFTDLTLKNVWKGIDIVFHAKEEGKLEYDYIVHAGANINDIQLAYRGQQDMQLLEGVLTIKTLAGDVKEIIPASYIQETAKQQHVGYALKNNHINFEAKAWDGNHTLVIDPGLVWGTYMGGKYSNGDTAYGVTVDRSGNVYVTGSTLSQTNISTLDSFVKAGYPYPNGLAFIAKFSSTGNLLWGTYYGNGGYGSFYTGAEGITTDTAGNVYISGVTSLDSNIATAGAYQDTLGVYEGSNNGFWAKFNSAGTLLYGTYFGASYNPGTGNSNNLFIPDVAIGIVLDAAGNVFIAGNVDQKENVSTPGAYETSGGTSGAYIAKFSNTGSLLAGTYYAASSNAGAQVFGLALDKSGNVFITGMTSSTSGIATAGAYRTLDTASVNYQSGFIAKFNNSLTTLVAATYYGGKSWVEPNAITTDASGNVFITGNTESTTDIATPGAYRSSYSFYGAGDNIFIAKFNNSLSSLLAGTYYGGTGGSWDISYAITTDAIGNVYITGFTVSDTGFATPGAYQTTNKGQEAYIGQFNNSLSNLLYSTFYGGGGDVGFGIALDATGDVYISGATCSTSGIATHGAYDTSYLGKDPFTSIFLAKFTLPSICSPTYYKINASICSGGSYSFGGKNYSKQGAYYDTLTNKGGCDSIVTLSLTVKQPTSSTTNKTVCANQLPYSWNGHNYSAAGKDTVLLTNKAGCDSVTVLVLAVTQPTTSTTNKTVCANQLPYSWNGHNYSAAGKDTVLLTNKAGCDSVTVLVLAVTQPTSSTTNVSVCSNQLPYSWNGHNYTSAGTDTVVLTNKAGCDSITVLHITVHSAPTAGYTLYQDTSVAHTWYVLNQCTGGTAPLTYVWAWGDGSPDSTGATPSHTYSHAGFFNICVTVTDSFGCTSTYCDSSTYVDKTTGTTRITVIVVTHLPTTGVTNIPSGDASLKVYPNPTNSMLNVTIPNGIAAGRLSVKNILGQEMMTVEIGHSSIEQIDISDLAAGVYFIQLQNSSQQFVAKVVKQ